MKGGVDAEYKHLHVFLSEAERQPFWMLAMAMWTVRCEYDIRLQG
jgi:hypothetical protein